MKLAVQRGIWVPTLRVNLHNIYQFSPYLTGNTPSPLQSPTG
jgi:hypothetical protein